jgi:hypothetical protein
MTIAQAIELVNTLKPNQYSNSQKVAWLSQLDGKIFAELISTHEGGIESFAGYTDETDTSTELLVKYPYDQDIYNYYLQSMIDRENGEVSKFNQSGALFNNAYMEFTAQYNRTHVPLPQKSAFRF